MAKTTNKKDGEPKKRLFTTKRQAAFENTLNLFRNLNDAWKVPPKLLVSDWADAYRRLSPESSAEAGRWRTSRAEYQREPMNAISDPIVKKVVLRFSSQTGKSECMNNILGYFMDYDPSPIMFLMPTEDVVKGYSQDRIAPMIRDTPVLSEKVVDAKSRDSGNTISYKKFIGGYVVFYGANAPAKLASRPIRVLLADEIDRFPMSAGEEGDPLKLAEVRQTTFWNKKTVVSSTPTIKGASKIDFEYEMSSQEVLHIACPNCGEYQPLIWANLKFRHFKEQETEKTGNKFELMGYACPHCGTIEGEVKWKKQMSHAIKWVAGNPDVKDIRGFHINALYSPWKKWESLVDDFLTAKKGGKEALKVFVNTMLAESWEDESDIDFNELLSKRRQYYNCIVPNDVVALTCGVDVQDNRLEYEIVGWSVGRVSWGIQYGVIHGDPANDETWDKLSAVLFAQYERQDGVRLSIMATCIDSGGHKTEQVYKYCKAHFLQNVYAIKGQGGSGLPYVKIPKNTNDAGVFLFIIGVDVGKDTLYSRLKVAYEDQYGFCHFPMESNRGYDDDYFKGLTSETKTTRYSKGVATITWEKRVSNARNEPLDIRNYATAALEIKALGMPRDLLEFLQEEIGATAQKAESFSKNTAATVENAAKIERRTTNFASKSNGGIKL